MLQNCVIKDNTGKVNGGGVSSGSKNCVVRNCLIVSNRTTGSGGGAGVYFTGQANYLGLTAQNCTIAYNSADAGTGGLYLKNTAGITNYVENTIVYFNAGSGDYTNWYGVINYSFTNCCIAPTNNHNGSGNVPDDPLFAGSSGADCHLTAQSPCVNAGLNANWMDNTFDLDGSPRLDRWSRHVDIGAYEYIRSGILFTVR